MDQFKIFLTYLLLLAFPSALLANDNNFSIEKEIQHYLAHNNVPALSIGIIKNGKVEFIQHYGVLNRDTEEAVTENTFYQIGSQTKVITSIIALTLINEGKLKLTDSVQKLIPDSIPTSKVAAWKSITIDDLLSHRSNLPNYPSNVYRQDGEPMLGGYNLQQLHSAIKNMDVQKNSEKKFSYSNFNYALLGYIITQVTNKSYSVLIEDYINKKYGLSDITSEPHSQPNLILASPYRKDKRNIETRPWDMGLLTPHGGLYSTVENLAKLMSYQLKAYRQKNIQSPLYLSQSNYDTGLYEGLSYGLGMFEATPELGLFSETVYWHGGDLDGYGCEYLFSPEKNSGVVLLTSSGGREFVMLARKIMSQLIQANSIILGSK
jgi:CubicO group peptidase (beta-lactamase class C family)